MCNCPHFQPTDTDELKEYPNLERPEACRRHPLTWGARFARNFHTMKFANLACHGAEAINYQDKVQKGTPATQKTQLNDYAQFVLGGPDLLVLRVVDLVLLSMGGNDAGDLFLDYSMPGFSSIVQECLTIDWKLPGWNSDVPGMGIGGLADIAECIVALANGVAASKLWPDRIPNILEDLAKSYVKPGGSILYMDYGYLQRGCQDGTEAAELYKEFTYSPYALGDRNFLDYRPPFSYNYDSTNWITRNEADYFLRDTGSYLASDGRSFLKYKLNTQKDSMGTITSVMKEYMDVTVKVKGKVVDATFDQDKARQLAFERSWVDDVKVTVKLHIGKAVCKIMGDAMAVQEGIVNQFNTLHKAQYQVLYTAPCRCIMILQAYSGQLPPGKYRAGNDSLGLFLF